MTPRVGFDYRFARGHAPGVGRYARELVRALVRLPDAPELALLDFGRAPAVVPDAALGLDGRDVLHQPLRRRVALPRRAASWLARIGLAADRLAGGVGIFQHAAPDLLPVARARTVFPLMEAPADDAGLARLRRVVERVDHLLVFSGAMEAFACDVLGFAEKRVHRVPVGADHWSRELRGGADGDGDVVLVLGSARRVRGHATVLRACEMLHAGGRAVRLRIAGGRGDAGDDLARAIDASPLRARVTWDLPAEADLPRIVACASVLVHLARDEGTAVTPLEAFWLGVPVVANPLPAFAEALDGAARFVGTAERPPDAAVLADAIDAALRVDRSPAAEERRRAIASRFTWEANARATIAAWRRMV